MIFMDYKHFFYFLSSEKLNKEQKGNFFKLWIINPEKQREHYKSHQHLKGLNKSRAFNKLPFSLQQWQSKLDMRISLSPHTFYKQDSNL